MHSPSPWLEYAQCQTHTEYSHTSIAYYVALEYNDPTSKHSLVILFIDRQAQTDKLYSCVYDHKSSDYNYCCNFYPNNEKSVKHERS